MLYFVKFIYSTFLLPPGILIVMLVLLGMWLFHKKYRSSSAILLGIALLFYLSANPFSGNRLIHTLEQRYQPPASVQGDVIVMLGGGAILDSPNLHSRGHVSGAAANRLLTCIQLYRQLQLPVIVSGGQVYKNTGREAEIAKQILNDAGIVHDKIIIENRSLNTSENAAYTKLILERHHFRRPILVTSAFHMPRAVKWFQKAGIEVTPYPTDFRTNARYRFILDDLIPAADAFNNFSLALKEYIGLFATKWY